MRTKGHSDEAEDKKLFSSMLKKALKGEKVKKHLKEDIRESKRSIKKDKTLIKHLPRGR